QEVHARQVLPGHGQAARPAAGREQQRIEGQHDAVVEAYVPALRGDLGDPPPEVRGDAMVGEELLWADEEPLALDAAGEVLLRERRALIGEPPLLAHHPEAAAVAPAAQRGGCLDRRPAAPGGAES